MNDYSDFSGLPDKPIAFHRDYVKITKSVEAAVLLGQAVYWQKIHSRKYQDDGWWWKTAEEWSEETGLTRERIEAARRACKAVLEYRIDGIPGNAFCRVGFYRVNCKKLRELLQTLEPHGLDHGDNPDSDHNPIPIGPTPQLTVCTESTTEITTTKPLAPLAESDLFQIDQTPKPPKSLCVKHRNLPFPAAEEIYTTYPRQIAKFEALRSITKAIKDFCPTCLIQKTQKYAEAKCGQDPNFLPYPATFFNNRRFLDDPSTWKTQTFSPPRPKPDYSHGM